MSGPAHRHTRAPAATIARALELACDLTGETPAAVMAHGGRARTLALAAVPLAVGPCNMSAVARDLGAPDGRIALWLLRKARKSARWWDEMWVDHIVGALVADDYIREYGERAL